LGVRPDVFPVLANLTEVSARAEVARAHGRGGIPSLEFGGELVVVLVIGEGASQTWVDDATAATLPPDAFPRAVHNLRARTKQPLRLTRTSSPKVGVWVAGEDDGLGSGRLLLRDLWKPVREKLPTDLLVRVPTRSAVLVSMDRPADIAFGEHLADQLVAAAEAKGAPVLARDWLMWTPAGWIARET
jgi:hypothetical protein